MKNKAICGIYKITNPIGKMYIGRSIDIEKRFYQHKLNPLGKLKESFTQYGYESHVFEVIEECGVNELSEREIYFIKTLGTLKDGLNTKNVFKEENKVYIYSSCTEKNKYFFKSLFDRMSKLLDKEERYESEISHIISKIIVQHEKESKK